TLLLLLNGGDGPMPFALPETLVRERGEMLVDTADPWLPPRRLRAGGRYQLPRRSIARLELTSVTEVAERIPGWGPAGGYGGFEMATRTKSNSTPTADSALDPAFIRRVVVERVRPRVDDGRFPIKRTTGERVVVTADVFADSHDTLAAALLYRRAGDPRWTE